MDPLLKKGLPANIEAERFVLGCIFLDSGLFYQAASLLQPRDFSTEAHRRIFGRMWDLHQQGVLIEYLTVSDELAKHGELESVGGTAYLTSLTDGMPRLQSIAEYVRVVKDKALLRDMIYTAQVVQQDCLESADAVKDILHRCERKVLGVGNSLASTGLTQARVVMESAEGGVGGFLSQSKKNGLQTGFTKFDDMTAGLRPGELVVIGGRPSQGKTAFGLNVAYNVASHHRAVAVFSLEMNRESLVSRLVCGIARVDHQRFRVGHLDQGERLKLMAAAQEVSHLALFIDDNPAPNQIEIAAKLRRHKIESGLDLIIVDYLQLMAVPGAENRNQELAGISRGFKMMAKDLGVPVILLSQLSRGPETRTDRRPLLSDLRDSGAIEQDADVVAFIFREEVYKPDRDDLKGKAELIVAKQRNGPTGTVRLVFLSHYTRFENAATEET